MTAAEIESCLKGGVLEAISLYQVNPGHIGGDDLLIIDAGIELHIDGRKFSFGWDSSGDMFMAGTCNVQELHPDLEHRQVEKDHPVLATFIGKRISGVKMKMTGYYELNEEMDQTGDELSTPLMLVLSFENGSSLQAAAIEYDLEGGELRALRFNLMSELLISMNRELPISEPG
jgi:hypothetical protein